MKDYKWPLDGELIAGYSLDNNASGGKGGAGSNGATKTLGFTGGLVENEKTVRIIHAEYEANSKWITLVKPLEAEQKKSAQRKSLLDLFTSELDLGKPARRIWLQEYSETQEVSTFDEIPSRSVIYVSTKGKPKERNMDNIHENLGRISDDLKLIEAFIETRKELTKKLYATPTIMRHGYPVEMKPRSKCMKTRLEYEEKIKEIDGK